MQVITVQSISYRELQWLVSWGLLLDFKTLCSLYLCGLNSPQRHKGHKEKDSCSGEGLYSLARRVISGQEVTRVL